MQDVQQRCASVGPGRGERWCGERVIAMRTHVKVAGTAPTYGVVDNTMSCGADEEAGKRFGVRGGAAVPSGCTPTTTT